MTGDVTAASIGLGNNLRAGPTDRLLPSTAVNNSILSLFLMVLRQYSFTLKHFFWWLTLYTILYLSFSRKVLVDLSFTTEYRLFLKKNIFGNQFIFSFVHPLSVLEDGVYSDTLLYSLSRGVSVVLRRCLCCRYSVLGILASACGWTRLLWGHLQNVLAHENQLLLC